MSKGVRDIKDIPRGLTYAYFEFQNEILVIMKEKQFLKI